VESDTSLKWVTIAATNIAILGVILSILALVFIHVYRTKPVIQLSQVTFLKLICVGSLFVNTSIFSSAFEAETTLLCNMRKWWFDITFTFTMSVLVVKVWRVWRVFNFPSKNGKNITNMFLYKVIATLVLVDIILLCLYSFVDGPIPVYLPEEDDYVCRTGNIGKAFLIISYIFLAVLVFVGAFFACRVRKLGSILGESKQIFLIINNIIVFGVFNVILYATNGGSEDVRVIIFAFSVFWCTICGLVILLHHKYEKFHLSRHDILMMATDKRNSNGVPQLNMSGTTNTGNTNWADETELFTTNGSEKVSLNAPRSFLYRDGSENFSRPATANEPAVKSDLFQEFTRSFHTDNAAPVTLNSSDSDGSRRSLFRTLSVSGRSLLGGDNSASASSSPKTLLRSRTDNLSRDSSQRSSADDLYDIWRREQERKAMQAAPASVEEKKMSMNELCEITLDEEPVVLDMDSPIPEMNEQSTGEVAVATPGGAPVATSFAFPDSADLKRLRTQSNGTTTSEQVAEDDDQVTEIVSKGFKIGEAGTYEEYVHRETGESFWYDRRNSTITHEMPTPSQDDMEIA